MFGGFRKANEHVYKKSKVTKNYKLKKKLIFIQQKKIINKRIKRMHECFVWWKKASV